MELRRNARGHRVVTDLEKRKILAEISAGSSPAEAARKYELAIWTVQRWLQHRARESAEEVTSTDQSGNERTVTLNEHRRLQDALAKAEQELRRRASRSLA